MAVTIKSPREIELMRKAGEILAATHEELRKALKPGMSTLDIDRLGEKIIRSYGCIPSFKNYNGYPASICGSVNDEVVHGIPSKKRIIEEGALTLDPENMEDATLIVQYAAWTWRKRDSMEGMPRMLRWQLNNRIMSEKAGAADD